MSLREAACDAVTLLDSVSPATRDVGPIIEIAATTVPSARTVRAPPASSSRSRSRRHCGRTRAADLVDLRPEHVGHHDRVARARRQPGLQPRLEHTRHERRQHLAGARSVDRTTPRVVADGSARRAYPRRARRTRRRVPPARRSVRSHPTPTAARRAAAARARPPPNGGGEVSVLDQPQPEPVLAGRRARQQPGRRQHRTRAMGGALGDADAPRQFAEAQLGCGCERVEHAERDRDRLQRRLAGRARYGGRYAVLTRR